jgi:hypothetical protein
VRFIQHQGAEPSLQQGLRLLSVVYDKASRNDADLKRAAPDILGSARFDDVAIGVQSDLSR